MDEEIFTIRKDKERAKSILNTAKERYSLIKFTLAQKFSKLLKNIMK